MGPKAKDVLYFIYFFATLVGNVRSLNSPWGWQCEDNNCLKKEITPETEESALSLAECRITCSSVASIWPMPTQTISIGDKFVKINVTDIKITSVNPEAPVYNLTTGAIEVFKKNVEKLESSEDDGFAFQINLQISNPNLTLLTINTNESYNLIIYPSDGVVYANVSAETFYGARHGLETLLQLIVYDELRDEVVVPTNVSISDGPVYPYRGILLDTARNFIDKDTIKRTLDAMGASKLNRFHWHITDSQSFPFVSKSRPDLSKFGAYSPLKIYTPEDVKEIVKYGLERGVGVVPEFDAPAHVGEGWQNTGLVTCFNWKPWGQYCAEPPCGQLDPTKGELYDVLEDIYGDMLELFQPDIFHMGGDEVNFNCWNSSETIVNWMENKNWGRQSDDFLQLWNYFQTEAQSRLYKSAGKEIPVVLWTSSLTESKYIEYLPKDQYIIQVWTTRNDVQIKNLLDLGYNLILSNYDALYFDCGFANWAGGDGTNWCSPYKTWQNVYENTPRSIAGDNVKQVLGAEGALWTEEVGSSSVDSRFWPRGAALAEVLWSEPRISINEAEVRLLIHTERLTSRGVNADGLQPEWCGQNQGSC